MICMPFWLLCLGICFFVGITIFYAARNIDKGFKAMEIGRKLGIKEERQRRRHAGRS